MRFRSVMFHALNSIAPDCSSRVPTSTSIDRSVETQDARLDERHPLAGEEPPSASLHGRAAVRVEEVVRRSPGYLFGARRADQAHGRGVDEDDARLLTTTIASADCSTILR